ncbi:hypothetical protein B19861_17190 [Bifidobacterium adolescentis]|uniref:Transposase n=1 Tax=Bifidobacterium adolescentis TaxID=1680 RepID=A0ABN6ZJ35_BIFAD|nr:hypothetical protein B19861_17190 [Bifidobacterium faecale]
MLLVRNRKNIRITWCDGRFRFRYVDASVRGFRMKRGFMRVQFRAVAHIETRGGVYHALVSQCPVSSAYKRLFGMPDV